MKIKLGNLKNIIEGLTFLASQKLPIKHTYWIGKTLILLTKEFQEVEACRYRLCLEHCKKDGHGNPVTKEENGNKVYEMLDSQAFQKELNDLWNQEFYVKFNPIPIEDLDGVKIDVLTMLKLEDFIVEEKGIDGNNSNH